MAILVIAAFDGASYPCLVADPPDGESPDLALPDATVEVDVEQALD